MSLSYLSRTNWTKHMDFKKITELTKEEARMLIKSSLELAKKLDLFYKPDMGVQEIENFLKDSGETFEVQTLALFYVLNKGEFEDANKFFNSSRIDRGTSKENS